MTTNHSTETPLSSTHQKPAAHPAPLIRKLALKLVASAVIASIAYVMYTTQQQLTKQIHTLTTNAITMKQQQIETTIQFDSKLAKLTSLQEQTTDRLSIESKILSKALQERWYQNDDWLLLKARYYMEMAEINNHWSENPQQTSIALLQQADRLLAPLHETQLYVVRQAIAKEISQLQTIPSLDTVGILAKLDAAQQLLITLPVKNPYALTKNSITDTTVPTLQSTWYEQGQRSIQLLKKLVLIRHHDETVEPLLSPQYESLLRETCFLNLQETQWAVIQHNQDVYQLALTQAINTIKRTFDLNAANTKTLLQQLDSLLKAQLNSKKPAKGESLTLLNHLIESKKSNSLSETPQPDIEPNQGSKAIPAEKDKSPVTGVKS